MSRNYEMSFQTLITKLKNYVDLEIACRICAVKGVKMFNLLTNPWETYFETITGINPLMDISHHVCYQCGALMKKYYLFRQKCLYRQTTMYECNSNNQEIKPIDYESVTSFNLSIYNVPPEYVYEYVYDENEHNNKIKENVNDTDVNVLSSNSVIPLLDHDYLYLLLDPDQPMEADEQKPFHTSAVKEEIHISEDLDIHENSTDTMREMSLKDISFEESEKDEAEAEASSFSPDKINLEEYCTIKNLSVEEQIEDINQRKNTSNYQNSPYKCDLCYKGFVFNSAFLNHMKKHDPARGDMECPICGIRFKKRSNVLKHARMHQIKYFCNTCDNVTRNPEHAQRHQLWHMGVIYKCLYCGETFTKKTSSLSHLRIQHPSEFICGECGYSFVSQIGLTQHKSLMHKDFTGQKKGSTPEVFRYCEECDVQFVSPEAWNRHLVTSAKHVQRNSCQKCGETFDSGVALSEHKQLEHSGRKPRDAGPQHSQDPESWPVECEFCGEPLANARERRTHYRRNHPDYKGFICEMCGKGFKSNALLVYHIRYHLGERPYKCDQCSKAFITNWRMLLHRQTHDDHRPFWCKICCRKFKRKFTLQNHSLTHTREKRYGCEFCGQMFTAASSVKLHVRAVHQKQPMPRRIRRSRAKKQNE